MKYSYDNQHVESKTQIFSKSRNDYYEFVDEVSFSNTIKSFRKSIVTLC